jgi:hypothetical protein
VYAGHAAVAIALKTREPRLPIAPLVVACFGPDWVELVIGLAVGRGPGEIYSHFIPAVIAGALVAAAAYAGLVGRSGARYLFLGWLLHWPADFLTAHKPLLNPGHVVGLDIYNLPALDFAIEALLVAGACVVYARAFAPDRRRRRWVAAMALALIALQGMLDFGLAHKPGRRWTPSLTAARWRSRPTIVLSAVPESSLRMPLAFSARTLTASGRWRKMEEFGV